MRRKVSITLHGGQFQVVASWARNTMAEVAWFDNATDMKIAVVLFLKRGRSINYARRAGR